MEESELQEMRETFAGLALPGVVGRSSLFDSAKMIAERAVEIADALIVELAKTKKDECRSNS